VVCIFAPLPRRGCEHRSRADSRARSSRPHCNLHTRRVPASHAETLGHPVHTKAGVLGVLARFNHSQIERPSLILGNPALGCDMLHPSMWRRSTTLRYLRHDDPQDARTHPVMQRRRKSLANRALIPMACCRCAQVRHAVAATRPHTTPGAPRPHPQSILRGHRSANAPRDRYD